MQIFQGSVDGEELTWNDFNKIWFNPLDDEDDRVLGSVNKILEKPYERTNEV